MAEKRMFSKQIVDSDAFLDMPVTSRLLYYDLGMRADDDGFVNSPKRIMRLIGASDDDLTVLCSKGFIIPFESGVVVIKHWRINNFIRKDRYKPTPYQEEFELLSLKQNGAYSLMGSVGQPMVNQRSTVGMHRLEENRVDKTSVEKNRAQMTLPILCLKVFNEVFGTAFTHMPTKNAEFLSTLEGVTEEDVRKMVLFKKSQWENTKYAVNMTPNTLFSPDHFEQYIHQAKTAKEEVQDDELAEYWNW